MRFHPQLFTLEKLIGICMQINCNIVHHKAKSEAAQTSVVVFAYGEHHTVTINDLDLRFELH